ncbi:MAG: FAD-dependent oxidoreductase, partial [Rubripirellula sp.]
MSKHVVIVGGGVIGLSTAWYCCQRGHQVTLIDRNGGQRNGCSFGNAGMIVPSHFVPLAAPGMIRSGLKWMWNPESPFYIRPRASWDLLAWLWRFKRACSESQVQRAAPLLRDLHLASRDHFQTLASDLPGGFDLTRNGLLMLCRSQHDFDKEIATAKLANDLGVEAEVLDSAATAARDPNIEMRVKGSVYYP